MDCLSEWLDVGKVVQVEAQVGLVTCKQLRTAIITFNAWYTCADHRWDNYVSGDWPISTHADPTSIRRAIFHEQRISSVTFISRWAWPARYPNRPIFGFWDGGAKFTKMCDSMPLTQINRWEKFDAASFILGGEISNPLQIHTHKRKNTNIQ